MKPICLIPARAGSKRIPGKNTRDFLGKPILQRSINNALDSKLFSGVYVSSEDIDILNDVQDWGAISFTRPQELASDEVGIAEVVDHFLSFVDCNELCMILATGVFASHKNLCFSYIEWDRPQLLCSWDDFNDKDAGQFYWISVAEYKAYRSIGVDILDMNIGKFRIQAIDINTEEDWQSAERLWTKLNP